MSKIKHGTVRITGSSVSFENRALITNNNKTYRAANPDLLPLDRKTPLIINGIEEGDNYKVNYSRGIVTFETTKDRGEITLDGAYLLTATFGAIEGINYDKKTNPVDATFIDDEHDVYIMGRKSTTVTIDTFYIWDPALEGYFNSEELFIVDIDINGYEESLLGFFDQASIAANGDDAVKRNLNFIGIEQ